MKRINLVLAFIFGAAAFITPDRLLGQIVIYQNDFETGAGPEWSNRQTSVTPIGARMFLGLFINDTVSLSLDSLPVHSKFTVSFWLYTMHTWDGNDSYWGPDEWILSVRGQPPILDTTFGLVLNQSYPKSYLQGNYPARYGAAEQDTLGYIVHWATGDAPSDAVWKLEFTFPHQETSLILDFIAILREPTIGQPDIQNECWGLDNVKIEIPKNLPPTITHTPVQSSLHDRNISINFTVNDPDGNLQTIELYYCQSGFADWHSEIVSDGINGEKTLSIPATFVQIPGVDYYLKATDTEGLEGFSGTDVLPHHIRVVDRWPVIIIPGIMGTHLWRSRPNFPDDNIWVDRNQLADSDDDHLCTLLLDEMGNGIELIRVGEILKEGLFINYYGDLITTLENNGYQEGQTLFTYPYDWRIDISLAARGIFLSEHGQSLDDLINQAISLNQPANQVVIIAHSQGGLLTRSYLARFGESKISKVIYLGTPHLGSPMAFLGLAHDSGLVDHFLSGLNPLVNRHTMSQVAITCPSVFQLLPRNPFIISQDLHRELTIDESYCSVTEGGFGFLKEEIETPCSRANPLNNTRWIDRAKQFHLEINQEVTVPQYAIVSTGLLTLSQLVFRAEGDKTVWTAFEANGDGTVPQASAEGALGADVTIFYLNQVEHSGLPNSPVIGQLVLKIINDQLDVLPANVSLTPYPVTSSVTWNTASPVLVTIIDEQGNIAGQTADNGIQNEISESIFFVFRDNEAGFLPADRNYQISIAPKDGGGYFSLTFEFKDETGEVTETTQYSNVPIGANSLASIGLTPDNRQPELALDGNSDGISDFVVHANQEPAPEMLDSFSQRGDINFDRVIDISDPVSILLHLFSGQNVSCVPAGDANSDGEIDIGDCIFLLSFLFREGAIPQGLIFCR